MKSFSNSANFTYVKLKKIQWNTFPFFLFIFLRFYLFFMRDGKERERNNEKHWLIVPWTGMHLQPSKPVTFCSLVWHPTNWTTLVMAPYFFSQLEHIVLKQDSSSSLLISCYKTKVCWVTEELTWLSIHPDIILHSSSRYNLTPCTKFGLLT